MLLVVLGGKALLGAGRVYMALLEMQAVTGIQMRRVVPAMRVLPVMPRPAYHKHFPVAQPATVVLVVMQVLAVQEVQNPLILGG